MTKVSLFILGLVLIMTTPSLCSTCSEYFGGQWYIHWYNCCNNCDEDSTYCDGWTWQGGSKVQYCGSCGENSFSRGKLLRQYECVSCDVQTNCTELIRKFNYPGLCWRWSMAFRGCCKKAANSEIQDGYQIRKEVFTFCGDGVCQEDESTATCPLDCCHLTNENCSPTDTSCSPTCCGDSKCCL